MDYSCTAGQTRGKRLRALVSVLLLVCVAFAMLAEAAVFPVASGTNVLSKNGTVIDASNASDGYIIVHHKASKKKLKLRIVMGKQTYTYDLNSNGEDEVFPLQLGSGKYEVRVYEQSSGKKYSQASAQTLKVQLNDENAAFLCPSQYVNYHEGAPCVAEAAELCAGLDKDKDKFDAIYGYLSKRMSYDYVKALQVTTGYLPDVDLTYENKLGICFDLSAIMCAMLRTQGIPVQLVIGYADKQYHAWNSVYLDGEWVPVDLTMEVTGGKVKNYSVERFY